MIKWTEIVEGVDFEKRVASLKKTATQWKKDLRRMTKLYKSLKTDDSDKTLKAFMKAMKAWQIFNKNWERWVFNELLDRKHLPMSDRQNGENIYQIQVREKGWGAHTSIMNLFPDSYDYHDDKHHWAPFALDQSHGGHDSRKTNINRYTRAFKKAFDAIDELITHEADKISEVIPDHQVNVSGINVLVKNVDQSDYAGKWIKKFFKSLPVAIKAIKKAGLKPSLRGFTIEINFKPETVDGIGGGLTAGAYQKTNDTLYIFPLGMSDNLSDSTLVHELGHRYWFRDVPNRAQKAWEDKINSGMIDINDDMIRKFCDRYFNTETGYFNRKKFILADVKSIDDPTLKSVFTNLADRTPVWSVEDKNPGYDWQKDQARGFMTKKAIYTGWMQKIHSGERITLEFISDYGNTNPAEAFAEVWRKWVAGRIGQLGPWTRAFFKEIVRTGGANIREKTTIKPWTDLKF